jgi:hypothetical protein
MNVSFLAPAQAELTEVVTYYNSQKDGLGFEFAEEVKKTIGRIIQYPEAWSVLSQRTRRCQTNRFPYGVIYHVSDNTLIVVGVMHLHRKPQGWKTRVHNFEQTI